MKTRLFVSHLPPTITSVQLRSLFATFGNIRDIYVPVVRETGLGKGIAFVEYATEQQAQNAITTLHGKGYKNKTLSVTFAKERNTQPKAQIHMQRKQPRKREQLDPNLFIKKAVFEETIPYVPKHAFADFALDGLIKKNIAKKGYVAPTPIQDQVIEPILEGKDVIGIANTGTGKTGGFLIPMINILLHNRTKHALVVVPTRELAVQIQDEFHEFAYGLPVQSVLCIGGANMSRQIDRLRRGAQLVIGTPGRLKDLIQHKALIADRYSLVTLDEVDRMLDMGFIKDVTFLIDRVASKRQSLFFSATIPGSMTEIMQKFLTNPVTVSVKEGNTNKNIEQSVVHVSDRSKKLDMLQEILSQEDVSKVLVFGRTKHGVEKIACSLEKRGFHVASIHGNKTQNRRQKAIQDFKQNRISILVATDVAARGLDIPNVTHVINYDAPEQYDEYVHRIGRTGRANKTGVAITFVE